jgi:branched-chain amino acid transport system substrate-binding protein
MTILKLINSLERHRSRRLLGTLSLVVGGALVLSACGAPGASTSSNDKSDASPITVGVLLPVTGSLAPLGNEMLNGYKVAQQMFNDAGGANGHPIELKISDAPDPEAAVSIAQKLSKDPSVSAILGSYSSGIAIPASAVADRNKKVYWETGSAAPETTSRNLQYLFRTNANQAMPQFTDLSVHFLEDEVAPALGKDIADIRIGLAYENGVYGTSGAASFHKYADANNWNVVTEQPYTATSNDLSSVVQNLKNSKVDVLFAVTYANDAILLRKQSKELGFTPKVIIEGGAGYVTPDAVKALGDDINGIVTTALAPMNITDDVLSPSLTPSYSEFVEKYNEMIGRPPVVHATIGFAGAMVLFQSVLAKSDPNDADSIVAAAKKVDIPDGGTVSFSGVKFDKTGQNERAAWYVLQYHDGVLTTVYPTEAAAAKFQFVGK